MFNVFFEYNVHIVYVVCYLRVCHDGFLTDKRSVLVTIRLSPRDLEKVWKGARTLWPTAPKLNRSEIIRHFALAGVDFLLRKKRR